MTRLVFCAVAALAIAPTVSAAQTATAPRPSEQRLSEAEREIQELWKSYFTVVRDDLPNTKAALDCSGGRYEEVKATNSFLVFFVACERMETYQGGHRAVIAIGNPHTFTFTLAAGTLRYGENVTAALVRDNQRVAFSTGRELKAGSWTSIEVSIPGVDARDLAKVIVEFSTGAAIGRGTETPSRTSSAPQFGLLTPPR